MKLVKSLLLGSAAGLAAVAGAQAADLPFRKAAPVDYVRVCDWTGIAGFFYIPGTDTCVKIGGEARFEYAYQDPHNILVPDQLKFGASSNNLKNGTFTPERNFNQTGFLARGQIDIDTRTQTAYGLLRARAQLQANRQSGNYNGAAGPAARGDNVGLDKGFITFAGLTAGRTTSFFDFYGDGFNVSGGGNYDGIAASDQGTTVLAYSATFGGGFSATISVEDPVGIRRDGIGNLGLVGAAAREPLFISPLAGLAPSVGATYASLRYPDAVLQLRYEQAWGAIQLSGAYHDIYTTGGAVGAGANPGGPNNGITGASETGFAVQGGIEVKLPMLAPGDALALQGSYEEGAVNYQDCCGNFSSSFTQNILGGFIHRDVDAVAIPTGVGNGYTLAKARGFSALGAFHHYFTPQFHDILYGSYEEIGYGNFVRSTDWRFGGIGDASQYKIGNQFIFTPVSGLDIGVDVMYAKLNQDLPYGGNFLNPVTGVVRNSAAGKANLAAIGIDTDPDTFEVRLRLNRDF